MRKPLNPLSVTSNRAKMFKHLDRMALIQDGMAAPVLLHLAPTNRCNMNCPHCCFSGRDKSLELTKKQALTAIEAGHTIGVKSVEYTGGGEPAIYPFIDNLIAKAAELLLRQGLNTNAKDINQLLYWHMLDWVRVSLNALADEENVGWLTNNVRTLQKRTTVSAALVVSWKTPLDVIQRAVRFAEDNQITTRLVPDCIQKAEGILLLLERMKRAVPKSTYAFVSDFNVTIERPRACLMHVWKPFAYADGWVYRCPSSELAPENGRGMRPEFRVCKIEEMAEYFARTFETFDAPCSYCKYTVQNEILMDVLAETTYNAFA